MQDEEKSIFGVYGLRIKQFLIIVIAVFLYGCQSQSLPTEIMSVETETPTPPLVVPTASQVPEEWVLWSKGPHANTYDGGSSSNTYCAQCHSPLNWNPDATSDTASVVSMGEWQNISCDICHASSGGQVSASIAWWDQVAVQNEPLASGAQLCEKCHQNPDEAHSQVKLGGSVHVGFTCVNCHDPHSTAASCSNSGCHAEIRPESSIPPGTPTGGQHPNNGSFCGGANCHPAATQAALSNSSIHGAVHASVSCIACHDSSGLEVTPSEDLGAWTTLHTVERDGVQTRIPYQSHEIQAGVDCTRCHFDGNQWGLPPVTGNEFGP